MSVFQIYTEDVIQLVSTYRSSVAIGHPKPRISLIDIAFEIRQLRITMVFDTEYWCVLSPTGIPTLVLPLSRGPGTLDDWRLRTLFHINDRCARDLVT